MPHRQSGKVKTTATVLAVIEALEELRGARVSELASHLDIAKSTAHRHLKTLERAEYVVKEGDRYRLGLRFFSIGERVRNRKEIYEMVRPVVDELADETEERALFMVEEHGRAVYLCRGEGKHAVQTDSWVGTRRYLHTVAGGKAILANLPDEHVEEILDRFGLPAQTTNTITARQELFGELERIREQGVAFNREETVAGLRAVSAPVVGADGRVYGSLSLSGPAHRMKGPWFTEEIPDLLLGTANELEINLAHSR